MLGIVTGKLRLCFKNNVHSAYPSDILQIKEARYTDKLKKLPISWY